MAAAANISLTVATCVIDEQLDTEVVSSSVTQSYPPRRRDHDSLGYNAVAPQDPMFRDVQPEQYPTVIREMIQHEDDVTNHRIMWLLVGQGFLANAFVSAKIQDLSTNFKLSLGGLLVSLSAFVMLYKSYQARGYLLFLGQQAKQGTLREEHLPLTGWPRNKIKDWWRNSWVCPWFGQTRDLFEPWLLLPFLFTSLWMIVLFHTWTSLNAAVAWTLGVLLSAVILSVSCVVMVAEQGRREN